MSIIANASERPITWLVDASIYVFRAWHQKGSEVDLAGKPVHAVRGFLRFVYQLLHAEQPTYIAFGFDTSQAQSVRKHIYPAYKANRHPTPEALKYQFQLCRDFLDALGLVQASSLYYEADDIIGTWVQRQRHFGHACRILTGDKDLAQLVAPMDLWWDYQHRRSLNDGGIKKAFGVWPHQIADQLAIAGDAADNIPGVPGVGMATAAKLLQRFYSCDILLSRIPEIGKMKIRGAKRLEGYIATHQETIRLSRQLTGVICHVPDIPLVLERNEKNPAQLKLLCEQLGLTAQQYQLWLAI